MSERAFHMTPAQAEILRELARSWYGIMLERVFKRTFKARRYQVAVNDLNWNGLVSPEYTYSEQVQYRLTDAGREALQRYEEGRA